MNRLQTELHRLYGASDADDTSQDADAPGLVDAEGQVRALVLELARPADWSVLALLWHGVQTDLALPAPAIVVNGVDGYQLWFSLVEPLHAAEGRRFMERLRLRYLGDVAPARIVITLPPAVEMAPVLKAPPGQWSAFVARDLAAVFADEPWLDMCPSPEAQADVLSRLKSIKTADFQVAFEQLAPFDQAEAGQPALALIANDEVGGDERPALSSANSADPKCFLLDAMNDRGLDMRLRIEAAKALLPYFEDPRGA